MSKTIMVCGTGSHVGKSVIVTGLCRIFTKDGFRVAPFKSQNMALNSYVTQEGGEMGRAQAVQAFASKTAPHVDMNPILIKPSCDIGAQVIMLGKVKGNMDAGSYMKYKKTAFRVAKEAFARLSKRYEIIVLEGAGSPSEINIEHDIANIPMARAAKAPVILVGDIDLGGVFAWVVGTLNLLKPSQRRMVKGIIINNFRGDIEILRPGLRMLEKKTGKPVLGVVPHFNDITIEEEDSVRVGSLRIEPPNSGNTDNKITIEVLRLPHISNFTDFDPLLKERDVSLRYVEMGQQIGAPDILILPGTKNTIRDLATLKRLGYHKRLRHLARRKALIIGICGGFQMLGTKIIDIKGSESHLSMCDGLNYLNIVTRLMPSKIMAQVEFQPLENILIETKRKPARPLTGYEIHVGRTKYLKGAQPLFTITKRNGGEVEIPDGAINSEGNVFGTYIHGIFDSPFVRDVILNGLREKKSLCRKRAKEINRRGDFDRLERLIRSHIAIDRIYDIMGVR